MYSIITFILAVLIVIYCPELFIGIILLIVLLCIYKTIKQNKKEKQMVEEKRIQEEKWINDLKNGKQVTIGICTIKCINSVIIINEEVHSINEIQKLDFTNRLLKVWKNKIDTTDYVMHDTSEYRVDDCSPSRVLNPNWGKKTAVTRMTVEEYYDELKYNNSPNSYNFYTYDFDKAYYISVTLYNGIQKDYLIGNCYCYLEPYINPPDCSFSAEESVKFKKMFNEVHNYIFSTEEEK